MPAANLNLLSPAEQELALLQTVKSMLDAVAQSLRDGEAEPLVKVSREINSPAQDLMALWMQLGHIPCTPEAQSQRRKLLAEIGRQRTFCRAMLRRWRRSITLRRQLLGLRDEPGLYTEALAREMELP
jgi:hypothetical protein